MNKTPNLENEPHFICQSYRFIKSFVYVNRFYEALYKTENEYKFSVFLTQIYDHDDSQKGFGVDKYSRFVDNAVTRYTTTWNQFHCCINAIFIKFL